MCFFLGFIWFSSCPLGFFCTLTLLLSLSQCCQPSAAFSTQLCKTRTLGGPAALSSAASIVKNRHSSLPSTSFVLRPHPRNQERGLVTLANYLICAESAYYVTITCLLRSRGSQLLLTMALQSRWADLAMEQPQGNPVRHTYTYICYMQYNTHKYAISFWNSRFTKSLLASFQFLSGLGTSLLPSHVKNVVIGNGQTWFLH